MDWNPPVGVFIAILGLLGVIVPLIRPLETMGKREKAIWTCIAFVLLVVELRIIYQDRAHHDKDQAEARAQEERNFKTIANGLQQSINQSKEDFDTTIGKIKPILEASETTLRNTQPYGVLEFQKMNPYAPSFPIAPGHQLEFNVWFTNAGNDVAHDVYYDVKFYVGKLDDEPTERTIAADFEKWWRDSTHRGPVGLIRPNAPTFQSFKTDPFTEDQVKALVGRTVTIYALIRFAYLDRTGSWFGDECFGMQDPMHDVTVGHSCVYHNNHRYRTNWKPTPQASKHRG
jgi:hypothetical protein